MSFVIIILLSIIQGITEFLPISSSGHLVLFYKLFKIESGTLFVNILLHVGTLFSILIYYRKELFNYLKNFKSKTTIKFLITTLSTIIIVLFFKKFLIGAYSGKFLIWCFIATSVVLFIAEQHTLSHKYSKKLSKNNKNLSKSINLSFSTINNYKSLVIGIVQGFAALPGISRSGSTISTALILNVNKKEAADYSFIISIPIILGSLFFEVYNFIKTPEVIPFSVLELIIGFLISFIVGLFSIKLLIKIINTKKLSIFSFYLLVLSLIIVIFNLV